MAAIIWEISKWSEFKNSFFHYVENQILRNIKMRIFFEKVIFTVLGHFLVFFGAFFEEISRPFFGPTEWPFLFGKVWKTDDFRDWRNLAASPKSVSWFWSTLSWKKKYLKILKIAQRRDLSIPHNIYSHSPKHRFRGFHPIFLSPRNSSKKNIPFSL